jgi:BBSome-interacting protein 1
MENILKEVVPKNGIIFNEKTEFSEVLCKPKLLPLKSVTIRKLEELEKNFEKANKELQKKK